MTPRAALAKLKKRRHAAGCQCRPCLRRKRCCLDGGMWRELAEACGESPVGDRIDDRVGPDPGRERQHADDRDLE